MMKEDAGERTFPVWLLGDSEPSNWRYVLDGPLDPRHPIRHNIWTSVLDVIQETIYLKTGQRFNSVAVYIRNAVRDVHDKPENNAVEWSVQTNNHVTRFEKLIRESQPKLILSFGAFAYEFARRANREPDQYFYRHWDTRRLGDEFRRSIDSCNVNSVNIVPLLHRSIAGGQFPKSHVLFCGAANKNYFNYVGTELAHRIMDIGRTTDIWMRYEK